MSTPTPTPAPAPTPTPAAAPEAAAEAKPSLKEKVTGAIAALKAKLKKPEGAKAASKPPLNVKLALKNLGKDIASIPVLLVKGDALTRLAVLGFTISLVLLIRVIPELPPLVSRMLGRPVAQAPSKAEAWSEQHGTTAPEDAHGAAPAGEAMGVVVFVGAFSGQLKPSVPYSAELFAETESEDDAEKLRGSLEKMKPALQKLLDDQLAADLETKEGKEELLARLKEVLGQPAVTKLFFTKFEMQSAEADAPAPAPAEHH